MGKSKMLKNIVYSVILLVLIIISLVIFKTNLFVESNDIKSLINISSLSSEFMDNYFSDIKDLNSSGTDNLLIIISKREIEKTYGATKVVKAPNNQYILKYKTKDEMTNAMDKLKDGDGVLSVEENVKSQLTADDNDSTINSTSKYNSWGIEKMGLDKAFNTIDEKKLNDVEVAILDSGCDMDLFKKYYGDKIVKVHNVLDDNEKMYDNNGHGTHIAGTIAEGTMDNVKIIPVKTTDSNTIDTVNEITAINWLLYNTDVDVINMSFGSNASLNAFYQTIEAAKEKNVIAVAAAGNDNNSYRNYPASYDNTISIASVDNQLNKSDFSNYGQTINFATPGSDIRSIMGSYTQISQNKNNNDDDDHEIISGTSMATPHGVCAVALLKGFNHDLTMNDTISLLKKHVVDLGQDGWDPMYGYGFIDFSNAKFCDGNECDEYSVFKKDDKSNTVKLDLGTDSYESLYNYGNNTNLLNMKVKVYYSDTEYVTKDLGELNDVKIENYDPYVEGEQIVTIKYNNQTINKKVINHLDDGWIYSDLNSGTITIKGINQKENYPKYIEIPKSYKGYKVEEIYPMAFQNKTELKSVNILADIKEINVNTFFGCTSLNKVILPDSVVKLDSYSFSNTTSLLSIDLPLGLQEIDDGAFYYSGIQSIQIPTGVKEIKKDTFNHTGLASITLGDGIEKIESGSLANIEGLLEINISKSVKTIDPKAFCGDYSVDSINIDNDNAKYKSEENSVTISEKDTNVLVFSNDNSTIPENVNILGPYSIFSTTGICKIPEGIKELKDYSLANCDNVLLPNSVSSIESSNVFSNSSYSLNFVHLNSYAYNYLKDNKIRYNILESEKVSVEIPDSKVDYKSFEKAEVNGISLIYDGDEQYEQYIYNESIQRFKIVYQNGDSFRYGDKYFTVVFDSLVGDHHEEKVYVNVSKAIPKYDIPSDLNVNIGSKLSDIKLPDGFHWDNPDQIIDSLGTQKFSATYTPSDTDNYDVVKGIMLDVFSKSDKQIIIPDINIKNKTFDGTKKISISDLIISNMDSTDYTVVDAYIEEADAGKQVATIKLRLSDSKYKLTSFDNGKQEKEFKIDIEVLPQKIKKPTMKNHDYVYNGKKQEALLDNFLEDKMTISGNTIVNAGKQIITISLKDPNYIWEDETNTDVLLEFEIKKADLRADYSISNTIVKYDGELHGIDVKIDFPKNIIVKYMDSEGGYTLDESPKYKDIGSYSIKYKISFGDNYNDIVEEKTLIIRDDVVDYVSDDYFGVYDGNNHSIKLKIDSDKYDVLYSVNNLSYDMSKLPEFKDVGEYIVNFKIKVDGMEDIEDSKKVVIYGIKDIDDSISLNQNVINVNNTSFKDLVNKLNIFSISNEITHLDNKENVIENDLISSGDILKIRINDKYDLKYVVHLNDDSNNVISNDQNNDLKVVVGDTFKKNSIFKYVLGILSSLFGLCLIVKFTKNN